MNIYEIPIIVSPQIVTLRNNTQIIDVKQTYKNGQLHHASIIASHPGRAIRTEQSNDDLVDCALYCFDAATTENCPSASEGRSFFNNTQLPLNDQESMLVYIGNFQHKFNKLTYYIYLESLYNAHSRSGGSSAVPVGRGMVSEDSLTRSIQ